MELAQIEAFLAAAENGSFRRAAEALILTQPSISARVLALENDLGVPLFHRQARGVRLTEMGRAFLPFAQRSLETLRQGREVLVSASHASAGVLNMATARAIGTYVLPGILQEYQRRNPGASVHIRVGRSSEVLQMVLDEQAQLGLSRHLSHPDVDAIHLYDEEIVLVTHPQHHFAIRGEASIQEVALEPLILYDPGSSYFVLINQVCKDAGVTPRVEMNLDSIEATKHMVELGMGISFLPLSGVRQGLDSATLSVIPLAGGERVTLPTCVFVRRGQSYSPTVAAFLELLRDLYQVDIPNLSQVSPLEGRSLPTHTANARG